MKDQNISEELIVSYIHQEVSSNEKEALQKKLIAEPEFESMMKDYQKLDNALRNIPKKQARDLVTERIMKNIVTMNKKSVFTSIQILSCVAIFFISLVGILFLQKLQQTKVDRQFIPLASNQIKTPVTTNLAKVEMGALDWLSQAQSANGSWTGEDWGADSQYTIGLSGLSLLAFASADQGENKNKHMETIKKGLQFILSTQNQDGSFGPSINNRLYNQGIATVALFKVKEFSPDLIPEEALKKSIDYITSCQNPSGGWGYFKSNETPNTSISIWQIHSLILAKQNGFAGLEDSIKMNLTWVQKMVDKNGNMGYRKQNDHPYGQSALTAMSGIFWLYEDEISDKSIEFKIKFQEDLERITLAPEKHLNYYQFYFLTSSLKKLKEKHQFELAKKVEDVLVAKQVKTGPLVGSWEPNDYWGPTGGRVYSTAMATISLVALQ